jgi:hypothetical protein
MLSGSTASRSRQESSTLSSRRFSKSSHEVPGLNAFGCIFSQLFTTACKSLFGAALCPSDFQTALGELARLSQRVEEAVYHSRKKDYDNPFRRATVRSEAEATAVFGSAERNPFVLKMRKDCAALWERIAEIEAKG